MILKLIIKYLLGKKDSFINAVRIRKGIYMITIYKYEPLDVRLARAKAELEKACLDRAELEKETL